MGISIDLKEKFNEYFNEQEGYSLRSDRYFDDITTMMVDSQYSVDYRVKLLTRWMEASFIQGARIMAQDTLDTLRDYATSMSEIDSSEKNTSQCIDNAADYLMIYYTKVLDRAEQHN